MEEVEGSQIRDGSDGPKAKSLLDEGAGGALGDDVSRPGARLTRPKRTNKGNWRLSDRKQQNMVSLAHPPWRSVAGTNDGFQCSRRGIGRRDGGNPNGIRRRTA
jgi:hypothetical protein